VYFRTGTSPNKSESQQISDDTNDLWVSDCKSPKTIPRLKKIESKKTATSVPELPWSVPSRDLLPFRREIGYETGEG
jgi:hypothetical protein